LTYCTAKNSATAHRKAIATIVTALDKQGIRDINYDHVTISVPKSDTPIWFNNRRFDIAYTDRDSLILIDVTIIDENTLKLWRKLQDGESEE
jgi:hypothetical protein